ncbi:MAG: protein translocase subunit SecDF [Putridiphycobacter sp.]
MRNKGFFWGITIALIIATIYQLSFTMAANSVEKEAVEVAEEKIDSLVANNIEYVVSDRDTLYVNNEKDQDGLTSYFADAYLKEVANESAHFSGATYADCKKKEISLGLDLKGGMSVTLEISVPELIHSLAGNTKKSDFYVPYEKALEKYNNGEGDFIDLFVSEFKTNNPEAKLAKFFHRYNTEDIAPDATEDEVVEFLRYKANSALDGVETIIDKRVNQFGVAQPTIQKQPATNRIYVELPGVKDKETVRRKLQATANLEFYETYDNARDGIGNMILAAEAALSKELFGDVLAEIESNKAEPVDTASTLSLGEGEDAEAANELTLEGVEDDSTKTEDLAEETQTDSLTDEQQRKLAPIRSYLVPLFQYDENNTPIGFQQGSAVGYAQVIDTSILNTRLNHPTFTENLPDDLTLMWSAKEILDDQKKETGLIYLYAIKTPTTGAPVAGENVDNSYVTNEFGEIRVVMRMTPEGTEKWGDLTAKNIGKQVAITMDNLVFSAPVVQEKMTDNASITGGFTMDEAKDLAGLLNAGSLPAPAKIVDETSVGPTLGAENIRTGFWSFVFAIILVLIYMVFYYGKAGIVADIALVVNMFLLVGALASFGAILTLPGIAGIVLTIGMSVDANVLIFERIREELRNGKNGKAALEEGFNKAMAAILDANITTLLTGTVLLVFGSGPIKGFAMTLIIGIFTSFFAAVVVSRLIFSFLSDRNQTFTFSTPITKNWFTNTNIAFVTKRKIFYALSLLVIIIGTVSLFTRGLDKGVDFTGGRSYVVEFQNAIDIKAVKADLTDAFEGAPVVKTVGNDHTAQITTKYLITDNSDEANNKVENTLTNTLKDAYGEIEIVSNQMIAPTISRDLKTKSFYAIAFSLVIIFLYILFRFRKWQFGLGALLAMAHDVIIVLSLFSIFHGWIGFSLEIDQAFIAAILTVVGYSINDTVVVFDRIREYLKLHPFRDRKDVINSALNSTMSRTINTSVSTFIVLLIIFLFGGESIKGFTFALMVGVVVGTYSSLFIATPMVIDLEKDKEEKKH